MRTRPSRCLHSGTAPSTRPTSSWVTSTPGTSSEYVSARVAVYSVGGCPHPTYLECADRLAAFRSLTFVGTPRLSQESGQLRRGKDETILRKGMSGVFCPLCIIVWSPSVCARMLRKATHRIDIDKANSLPYEALQQEMRGYFASISFLDHQIGRVLDALDQAST